MNSPALEVNEMITNPLRPDSHPGCYLRWYNNTIFLTDFAYPKYNGYTCVHAVADIKGCNLTHAASLIMSKFLHGYDVDLGNRFSAVSTGIKKKETSKHKDFFFEPYTYDGKSAYTIQDKQYWSVRGVTANQLRKYNVYSIKKWYCNDRVIYPSRPSYAYYFPHDGATKIYSPSESKEHRFPYASVGKNHIWRTSEVVTSDMCIITKSLKDLMVLENALPYVDIYAFQNEGVIPDNLDKFKSYDRVFIFYDNDRAGRSASLKLQHKLWELGIESYRIEVMEEYVNCKDADDVRVKYSETELCSMMSNLLSWEELQEQQRNLLLQLKELPWSH